MTIFDNVRVDWVDTLKLRDHPADFPVEPQSENYRNSHSKFTKTRQVLEKVLFFSVS